MVNPYPKGSTERLKINLDGGLGFDTIPPKEREDDSPQKDGLPIEYLLVSDKNSKVLLSTTDYEEARKLAKMIRSANGEVTVFRSLSA